MTEERKTPRTGSAPDESAAPKRRRVGAASAIEDEAVTALAKALNQTRVTLLSKMPESIWQHKIMPLLSYQQNASTQQLGFLVLPESKDHMAMMKSTELHLDVKLSPQLIDFWQRTKMLESVKRLTGKLTGGNADDRARLFGLLKPNLRAVNIEVLGRDFLYQWLPHGLTELVVKGQQLRDTIQEYLIADAKSSDRRLTRLSIPYIGLRWMSVESTGAWPVTRTHFIDLIAILPESLTALDLETRTHLFDSEIVATLLKKCQQLVELSATAVGHGTTVVLPGDLAKGIGQDRRPWASFSWNMPDVSLSWDDVLPIANEALVAFTVRDIEHEDKYLEKLAAFLAKCPKLETFHFSLDAFAEPDWSRILEVFANSPCSRTLRNVSAHDMIKRAGYGAVWRTFPRLADVRSDFWKALEADAFDVLLATTQRNSKRTISVGHVTSRVGAEQFVQLLRTSNAWTKIDLACTFRDSKSVESKEVLSYLADNCPDLAELTIRSMFREIDGPALLNLLSAMDRTGNIQLGDWYEDVTIRAAPAIRVQHLGTWRTRPRAVYLSFLLENITAADLLDLMRGRPAGVTYAYALMFYVSRQTARQFLEIVPPGAHFSFKTRAVDYRDERVMTTVADLDSVSDQVFGVTL